MILKTSITRPANTTAYADGDVINANGSTTPIELVYTKATDSPYALMSHLISSNEAGTPEIDVLFFSSSFTIVADNAPFAPSDSEMALYLGKISHDTWIATAANKTSDAKAEAPIGLSNNSGSIYVVLVARAAYTPISAEVITIVENVD